MLPEASKHALPASSDSVEEYGIRHTFHQHGFRFTFLGAIIVVLTAVVLFLYNDKVGNPVDQLEANVETEVFTQPVASANPEEVKAASAQSVSSNSSGSPILYKGNGIECPSGTNRMIYIDEQALCCQGTICKEPN